MDDTLNEAPCGFLSFTDDGTIRAVNATLLRLLGFQRDEIENQPVGVLLSAGSRVFYQTHLFPLLKMQGKAEEIYLSLRSRDGDDIPVLVNAARHERDGASGNECILVPMRQRIRHEEEILQAKKATDEANQERERAYTALAQAHVALARAHEALAETNREMEVQQLQMHGLNAQLHTRAEREALLNRLGQILRAQGGPEAVLTSAVALLGEALGADRCWFAQHDIAMDRARVTAEWRRPGRGAIRRRLSDAAAALLPPRSSRSLHPIATTTPGCR